MRWLFLGLVLATAASLSPLAAETANSPSALAEALGAGDDTGYARALTPRTFEFPADHGPHPDYRNEWWYVTGNLDGDAGERYGFELTIFRVALAPGDVASPSAWRTRQVWFAHFALTDVANGDFHVAERFARGAAGLAGSGAAPLRTWIGDWSIAATGAGRWRLVADDDDFGIDVVLEPQGEPVLNGEDGLSQKSPEPGNASYYYSMPRLATTGQVRVGDEVTSVTGLAWLDREWSTSALAANQAGWDWYALQLDDGSTLMFYALRQSDGTPGAESAGTFVAADGRVTHLDQGDVNLDVTATWDSPLGGTYPAGWSLAVPSLALELAVAPVLADQELDTIVRYWEGAVDAKGSRRGRSVQGRGYVELTGYAE